MSTEAQIAANRANAELSTGPKTEEGKAASSRNHTSHGLTYSNIFFILPCESGEAYSILLANLHHEHRPDTETERILVDRMAQHHWLRCRAEGLESGCFREDGTINEKGLALYLRYRTSHERAFHKCLNELLKLAKNICKFLKPPVQGNDTCSFFPMGTLSSLSGALPMCF